MMARSPYTEDVLFALESARARGVLKVEHTDGSKVEYRSLDEMDRIIRDIKKQLARDTGYGRKYAQHSNGFGA